MRAVLMLSLLLGCRSETPPHKSSPPPPAPVVSASAPVNEEVSYATLCARSTPREPTNENVQKLVTELGLKVELRAMNVLGALPGVDARKRGEVLAAGAKEQGLKACPLADLWIAWSKSDAG
jgi:hypothetical protein